MSGFADVIQDELNVRALAHHLDGVGHLTVGDTDIEAQAIVEERLHPFHKI